MAITFRQKYGGWRLLQTNLKPRLEEMPELAQASAQLEEIIARAEMLQAETEVLKGSFQKTARLRREIEREGELLRQRIGAALQFKLGFQDETLVSYGVAPRRARKAQRTGSPGEAPGPVVSPPAPNSPLTAALAPPPADSSK